MTAVGKLHGRFTEADIEHEIVIMRLDTGEFFSLAGTGAAIWRLIDGERDEAEIVAAAKCQFDAADSDIAKDIHEFLAKLRGMGFLDG